jgi:hypothetical protein
MNAPTRSTLALGIAALIALALAVGALTLLHRAQAEVAQLAATVAKLELALAAAKSAERIAVQKTKWRQKAAAKAKRIATVVPFVGAAVVVWLEELEYREWREEHPELVSEIEARKAYYQETYALMREVLEEEFKDLKGKRPEVWLRAAKAVDEWYQRAIASAGP